MTRDDRLTVYYDASCPLCATEMGALQALAGKRTLELVDCSADGFDAAGLGDGRLTREAMLARLHARTADGQWRVGVAAFEAAYAVAGFARLARLIGSRALRPVLERIYPWIADNRQCLSRFGLPGLLRRFLRRA